MFVLFMFMFLFCLCLCFVYVCDCICFCLFVFTSLTEEEERGSPFMNPICWKKKTRNELKKKERKKERNIKTCWSWNESSFCSKNQLLRNIRIPSICLFMFVRVYSCLFVLVYSCLFVYSRLFIRVCLFMFVFLLVWLNNVIVFDWTNLGKRHY